MITKHKCDKVKETSWKDQIRECCEMEDPDDPRGCDCCYDTWTDELKEVNTKYSEADEEARYLSMELAFISGRRDKLKNWYDELTKVNDMSREICDQVEVMLDQIDKVCTNTEHAVKAIRILYCMIRDFYMQVDLIKTKYDLIFNCIRCLNDPVLVAGQGIMKCLEDYGKKLDVLIATRDEIVRMVINAIHIAYRINKSLGEDYGFYMMIREWKITLNCDEHCDEGGGSEEPEQQKGTEIKESQKVESEKESEGCKLRPRFDFPICNDPYYEQIKDKYEADKAKAGELAVSLTALNKKKGSLLACKQSLETAIKEVDPRSRC